MEGSIKNICRPSNEKHHWPCKTLQEVKNLPASLLQETRPSLKEDHMEEVVQELIAKAEDKLNEEKRMKADKRKNFIKVLSSAISNGKNESPTASSSSFKPLSVSTPKFETGSENKENCKSASENQERGASTSKIKSAPKGKSNIPVFQRKWSSMRETKTVRFEATPVNLSVSQRLSSPMSEFTPKREFQSKVSSNKIQATPRHLCETRYGKTNSNSSSSKKEKPTTKQQFALRTVSTSASRSNKLASKSDGITSELRFLRDSLREVVADFSSLMNKK